MYIMGTGEQYITSLLGTLHLMTYMSKGIGCILLVRFTERKEDPVKQVK